MECGHDAIAAGGTEAMDTSTSSSFLPFNKYNLLIEFAHRHLDFQHAELESILSMNGIKKCRDYDVIHLPNELRVERKTRAFLILSFAFEKKQKDIGSLLSRCLLIRSVIELWGLGCNMEECARDTLERYRFETQAEEDRQNSKSIMMHPHFAESKSWKMTVHTFGSKYTREEQGEMRANFSFLPFLGPVRMVDPTDEYIIIHEIQVSELGSPILDDGVTRPPCIAVYFGRILGSNRNWREGRIDELSLKRRKYLGPTSMDAELSMIMTNIAQVQKGTFCFDPFAGTGSILLTCALQGAYCFGTDIDIRVLRGKGVDENILSNFKQYDLIRPELVRSDNSIYHRHYRWHQPIFDAIVCDPPYGIRAGARQSGTRNDVAQPVPDEWRHDHIAQTKPYPVSDVMADLLDVAAKTLVQNGRLVYIIPSMTDFDINTDLPRHPCLRLVCCCYQPLQANLGRRVVCMDKIKEYEESKRDEYKNFVWVNGPESAEKCANIRERLLEEAKKKPGYAEKAEMRRKKRRATKEERKREKQQLAQAQP